MEFFEQWDKLKNLKAKVLLKHSLFGRQIHNCDKLQIINDDRVGLVLKGQEIFVYKDDVVYTEVRNGTLMVADENLIITIFVNKL